MSGEFIHSMKEELVEFLDAPEDATQGSSFLVVLSMSVSSMFAVIVTMSEVFIMSTVLTMLSVETFMLSVMIAVLAIVVMVMPMSSVRVYPDPELVKQSFDFVNEFGKEIMQSGVRR